LNKRHIVTKVKSDSEEVNTYEKGDPYNYPKKDFGSSQFTDAIIEAFPNLDEREYDGFLYGQVPQELFPETLNLEKIEPVIDFTKAGCEKSEQGILLVLEMIEMKVGKLWVDWDDLLIYP
jgi:hypothetical protein